MRSREQMSGEPIAESEKERIAYEKAWGQVMDEIRDRQANVLESQARFIMDGLYHAERKPFGKDQETLAQAWLQAQTDKANMIVESAISLYQSLPREALETKNKDPRRDQLNRYLDEISDDGHLNYATDKPGIRGFREKLLELVDQRRLERVEQRKQELLSKDEWR